MVAHVGASSAEPHSSKTGAAISSPLVVAGVEEIPALRAVARVAARDRPAARDRAPVRIGVIEQLVSRRIGVEPHDARLRQLTALFEPVRIDHPRRAIGGAIAQRREQIVLDRIIDQAVTPSRSWRRLIMPGWEQRRVGGGHVGRGRRPP
jgi:hypothetical protein